MKSNKWLAVVVLDLMVLTFAVGLKAVTTRTSPSTKTTSQCVSAPVPW